MAARLTVLYGPSGVGKSSVLNAGALKTRWPRPARLAADGRPQVIGIAFQRWQENHAAWARSSTRVLTTRSRQQRPMAR